MAPITTVYKTRCETPIDVHAVIESAPTTLKVYGSNPGCSSLDLQRHVAYSIVSKVIILHQMHLGTVSRHISIFPTLQALL